MGSSILFSVFIGINYIFLSSQIYIIFSLQIEYDLCNWRSYCIFPENMIYFSTRLYPYSLHLLQNKNLSLILLLETLK